MKKALIYTDNITALILEYGNIYRMEYTIIYLCIPILKYILVASGFSNYE